MIHGMCVWYWLCHNLNRSAIWKSPHNMRSISNWSWFHPTSPTDWWYSDGIMEIRTTHCILVKLTIPNPIHRNPLVLQQLPSASVYSCGETAPSNPRNTTGFSIQRIKETCTGDHQSSINGIWFSPSLSHQILGGSYRVYIHKFSANQPLDRRKRLTVLRNSSNNF